MIPPISLAKKIKIEVHSKNRRTPALEENNVHS